MNPQKEKKPGFLRIYTRMVRECFRVIPVFETFHELTSVLHGASWAVLAIVQQRFFDAAAVLAEDGNQLQPFIAALILFLLIHVLCQILNGIDNYLYTPIEGYIRGALKSRLHTKMNRLDPILYEDTGILERFNKASEGVDNAIDFTMTVNAMITFYGVYFVIMAFFLFSLKPILTVAILLIFVPTAITQFLRVHYAGKLEDDSAPVRREMEYYEKCIADREYYRETRLFGAFHWFIGKYRETMRLLHELRLKTKRKSTLIELTGRFISILGYVSVLIMALQNAISGEISIGAFAAVLANIGSMFSIMEEVICSRLGSALDRQGSTANYIQLLDMPERGGKNEPIPNGDIVLEHVSFTYPGMDKPALEDVSFRIYSGETLAVVGSNGAGKSTFARVLIGMYTPQKGRVLRGGVELRNADLMSIRKNVSAVFQKFRRYRLTLGENLAVAEPDIFRALEENGEDIPTVQKLKDACGQAELEIRSEVFPNGIHTMLTREFDEEAESEETQLTNGVELSGGQWQKVAIARAYCRDHDLIILDEPTASIDPLEEQRIYERFSRLAKGKTAVIVTHRLGSVRMADRILVLEDGHAAEYGTHEELMKRGGLYAKMYESQRQWYS